MHYLQNNKKITAGNSRYFGETHLKTAIVNLMENNEIENFVENNIKNFQTNGKGWNKIIREMLIEFAKSGWNLDNQIFGKEKYACLQCSSFSNDSEIEIFRSIRLKFKKLSGVTCQECGDKSKQRIFKGWEYTLCKNCYLEKATNEIYLKQRSNLEECKFCGYFAFSEDKCKFCGNYDFKTTNFTISKEDFANELEYIKYCQMEVYVDNDDEIELSKRTKGYSKSEKYKILFSDEELKEYIEMIKSWDEIDNK